jgi:NADPH-dependent 2,4-dienoyl-CoA reductase/sulfur reductase-like enzyme/nitrite reductase/ring-hydroxylating ferredoxin subunit
MPDFVRVADASSFADGEMRQVQADGTDVLLARVDGRFHACTAFCTHYGAPLATGVLSGTTVLCPWHHAAFDVATGALAEPPALDALRSFDVKVEGDSVLVRVPDDADEHGKGVDYRESDGREPAAPPASGDDDRLFLVLGAGAAAQAAAEALRASGYRGRLALVTREPRAPYDRTKLSKTYLGGDAGDDALPLRDAAFYERHAIEVWTDRTVTALDPGARQVTFEEGDPVTYDACLVATGGVPRRLPIDGADLEGVHTLRSWRDAREIVGEAEGARRAVVIGASFIGMECASQLNARGIDVTVVGKEDAPFAAAMGERVGNVFQAAAEEKGVRFRLGAEVERIEKTDDGLRVVVSSEALDADLVVMGVGVRPATDFVPRTLRRDDGGLTVDAHLQLADGLFAAGDVAAYPDPRLGRHVRIEHWRLAQQHGRLAAHNMIAEGDPTVRPARFESVPFFWTGQFGLNLRYVGHAEDWDEVVVDGSLDDRQFLAAYVEGGEVRAVAAVGRDQDAAAFHHLMARGQTPTPAEVRAGLDLQARLAEGAP